MLKGLVISKTKLHIKGIVHSKMKIESSFTHPVVLMSYTLLLWTTVFKNVPIELLHIMDSPFYPSFTPLDSPGTELNLQL